MGCCVRTFGTRCLVFGVTLFLIMDSQVCVLCVCVCVCFGVQKSTLRGGFVLNMHFFHPRKTRNAFFVGDNAWFESSNLLARSFHSSRLQEFKAFRIFMYFRSSEPQEFKINSHHQQISTLRSSRQISTLSRALALAGCDRSERASVGKVSRPPHPSLRFFRDFVLCQVRGHLVRLATTSSAFPPKDAETMRRARSHAGPR